MKLATPSIIEGSYLRDLLAQPDVLQRVAARLASSHLDAALTEGLRSGRYRHVALTGMGSSLHALYPLHRVLSRAGIASHWIETAELLLGFEALYSPETLLIGVSQSGESAEMVSLAERTGEFGHFVGITNNDESTLGRAAGTRVMLEAGVESTVSCKTYVATLAVLHWLGAQLINADPAVVLSELAQAETAVRDYLAGWREHVEELLTLLKASAEAGRMPINEVAQSVWGRGSIAVTFTALSATLALIIATSVGASRVLFAKGRRLAAPAIFAQLHPRYAVPWPALHFIFALGLLGTFTVFACIGAYNAYVWWATTSTFFAMLTFLFGNLACIILNRHRLKSASGLLFFGLVPAFGIVVDFYILVQSFFIELWAQPWATGKSVVVFDVACAALALGFVLFRQGGPSPSSAIPVAASLEN